MVEVYTDGASRGNPGESASSFLIVENGKVIFFSSAYIGKNTNNVAEYQAIINALTYATAKKIKRAILTSDSELVISQIIGKYRVKAEHLKKLYSAVMLLSKNFDYIKFQHSKRENQYITIADKLCNLMLNLK